MDIINVEIGGNQVIAVTLGNETPDYIVRKEQIGLITDTTFTDAVPAGYLLKYIVVSETTGNAVAGFKIGTSAGIDDVVSIENVAGSENITNEPNSDIDFDNDTTLYISADTWGSGSINCYFIFHRIA